MLNKLLKSFKHKIIKNAVMVISGNVFAQFLNIIFTPVLIRIFTPDEYGLYSVYVSILGVLSIGTFRYELALPIEKDDKKAFNILILSLGLITIYSVFLCLLFLIFGKPLFALFQFEEVTEISLLIPIGIFFSGIYAILNRWAYRNGEYQKISRTLMRQGLFSNLSKILAGLLNFGVIGLIIGHIIGTSAGIITLAKSIIEKRRDLVKQVELKLIIWSLRRYKDFPLFNMPSALLISSGSSMPVMFLTAYYGSHISGYFALAYTIVKLPMNIIGNALGDVLLAESGRIGKNEPHRLMQLSNQIFRKLLFLGMIPLLILVCFGPDLFAFVFGSDWRTSGEFSRIIALMIFCMLVFSPFGKLLIVLEKQKLSFLLDVIRTLMVAGVFLIAFLFELDSFIAISLYSLVMSIYFFMMFLMSYILIRKEMR